MPTKDRGAAHREFVRRLERRVASLKEDACALEQEHADLDAKHSVLQHVSELLAWILHLNQNGPDDRLQHAAATASELLQEPLGWACSHQEPPPAATSDDTNSKTTSGVKEEDPAGGVAAQLDELVAPPDQPLQLLRLMLAQPPYRPEPFTLENMLQEGAADVRKIALLLHKISSLQSALPPPTIVHASSQCPYAALKQVLQRRMWVITSLAMQRQTVLLTGATLVNWDTGEVLAQPDEQQHLWAVSQLGLTEQQLQRMVASFRVYRRLLKPLLEEVRQLQSELGSSGSAAGNVATGPAAAASEAGAAAAVEAAAASDGRLAMRRIAATEQQQQKAQRLNAVMHKDYLLKLCSGAHLYGCMTWVQLGKLLVLMAPHFPLPGVVGTAVERLWAQEHGAST